MKKHKRRKGCYMYYHAAHTKESGFLISNIVSLIKENPCPVQTNSGLG